MQRRTLLIVIGSVLAASLLVCGVVGGLAWYVLRQVNQQQQAVFDTFASTLAQLEATSEPAASAEPGPAVTATVAPAPAETATTTDSPAAEATPAASASPESPPPADGDVTAALVPASRAKLAERADATLYQIAATLDPEQRTIAGQQTVTLQNTEDAPLSELYFRLYVNAPHYREGGIEVTDVQVDGAAADTSLEQDDTALKIALPAPLAPGARATVVMRFTTTVPTSGGGYGIFNESNGIFTLYNWHPELAVYERGAWLLNPVSDQGDPTNTDAANYDVAFTTPDDYTVITSGLNVAAPADERAAGGLAAHHSVGALTRNFVVVASDRFEQQSAQVGDTKVTSYYLPDSAAGGKTALDTTVKSLGVFGKAFGPYPYAEMDVAQVDLLGGAAGMESTGLIMIGSDLYGADGGNPLGDLGSSFPGAEGGNALIFTTAHEAAHQWWYGVVGSDAYTQPWLDESLTNWSSAYYVDQVAGEDAGKLARDIFIGFGYRSVLAEGDQRLDQPVDAFDSQGYSGIVYGKGSLMYDVLRAEIGDDAFFSFLKRYYAEQQFDRADSMEWLATLNAAAGKDMSAFYQKWVEGTAITPQDLPPAGPLSALLGGFDAVLPDASPAP